jgi:hypothetical protein
MQNHWKSLDGDNCYVRIIAICRTKTSSTIYKNYREMRERWTAKLILIATWKEWRFRRRRAIYYLVEITIHLFRKLSKKSLMCNMPALFQKSYPLWFIASLTLYREDSIHHLGTCWGFPCVLALETFHYYPMNIIELLSFWISSHLAMESSSVCTGVE